MRTKNRENRGRFLKDANTLLTFLMCTAAQPFDFTQITLEELPSTRASIADGATQDQNRLNAIGTTMGEYLGPLHA